MSEVPWIERTYTLRGYEVDASRTTPLPVLLSFLEQLRWEWIADPEWGLERGVHGGHFFVVRRQVVEAVERPRFGEPLTVRGALEKVGRSQVQVRHVLHVRGRIVAHARVTGVWLGPDRRLARLPDTARDLGRRQAASLEIPTVTGAPEDAVVPGENPHSFLDAPRRVFRSRGLDLEPPTSVEGPPQSVRVRPSDCDVFAHVNASQYLRYFDDARRRAGVAGDLHRVAIDYRNEALADEDLELRLAPRGEHVDGLLTRDEIEICAVRMGIVPLEPHGA